MALRSLADCFFRRAGLLADSPAIRFKEDGGFYQDMTWRQLSSYVTEIAFGLSALGLEPKERVAIFASNSPHWVAFDLAALTTGAISVPIYPTSSQVDIESVLANSGASFILVENEQVLRKVLAGLDKLPQLKVFISLSQPANHHTGDGLRPITGVSGDRSLIGLGELRRLGQELMRTSPGLIAERMESVNPGDLATIIYTSGTTGTPKGVGLMHSNILAMIEDLTGVIPIGRNDIYFSYLPMSHVFERVCGEFYWSHSGGVFAFAESVETMAKNLAEVQPTILLVVPRVLDRIYAKVKGGIEGASGRRRKLIEWAVYVGKEMMRSQLEGKRPSAALRISHWLAEKLVLSKMRDTIGPHLRVVVSGGAPATPHVIEFFNAIGITTLEGYGLTESAAPATVNRFGKIRIGSVGPALPSLRIKLGQDGEVLLKGPTVFAGYFMDEASTAESFTDGWFHTGDIGTIDGDGYLRITDRKKDIIVNAAGKNIAPQRVEAVLKTVPFVSQCVVFGDKQNHLSALITLDEMAVTEFAHGSNWRFADFTDLVRLPELSQYIRKEIQLRSGHLSDYEHVRRFVILPNDLSVENGELTATLKVKRSTIARKYKNTIEDLYNHVDRELDSIGDARHPVHL